MNIMLVSVTERTREIGIRMAIGAREADIRSQFLVEAVVLASAAVSAASSSARSSCPSSARSRTRRCSINVTAATISVIVSAAIGVIFGFFPARRAARLDPIEALRRE